ncbi:hypothetical protein [Microlunatus sp. GCM10028923]|uniref:hypothetical protein n=1 Tax=Microlunatus sp. GCM10028923 TaxID=3273400 RepID=UPI0036171E65
MTTPPGDETELAVRAVGRGVETGATAPAGPGPEHARLGVFIGRWINEGETVNVEPAMKIITSDVYDWIPGGFFVLHTAYGKTGPFGGGATEIIGWDETAGRYRSWLFDSGGNATEHTLSHDDGRWTWQGESTRCTATFSKDGRVQSARHERLDGDRWIHTMDVALTRID